MNLGYISLYGYMRNTPLDTVLLAETAESGQEYLTSRKELKKKYTQTNNTIAEMKNSLEGINSRMSEAEEWISELEDKMVEITSEEQNKVKRMKTTEDSLRDLWDIIKRTNIRIIRVPEEEKKKVMRKSLMRL